MLTERPYQMCTHCVMDTSDMDIEFDATGRCNHCREFEQVLAQPRYSKEDAEVKLKKLITQIKTKGKGKKYDCLMGISGGVDSCYTAYLCHQWGLRPLLMHMDNGWNSELSVQNIENIVRRLDIDLYTYVIDWEEFKDIQLSCFIIHPNIYSGVACAVYRMIGI